MPCGESSKGHNCPSWILLNVPEDVEDMGGAADKKDYIYKYLSRIGWKHVTNDKNKRFICPNCSVDGTAI